MGIGYSGKVKLDGNIVYATNASITVLRDIVESGGAYGGKKSGSEMATGAPHFYEPWKTQSSVSFDVTEGTVSTFSNLLKSRDTTYDVELRMGSSGSGVTVKQYWTSMGLGASRGSLVSGSVEGVYFEKNKLASAGNDSPKDIGDKECDEPIAYWQTGINGGDCLESWNFSATQPVSPIYCCIGSDTDSDNRDPDYIVLGQVQITITASAISGGSSDDTVTITIGNASLSFSDAEIQDESNNVTSGIGMNTYNITWRAYSI